MKLIHALSSIIISLNIISLTYAYDVPSLIDALGSKNKLKARSASDKLAKIGKPAVPELIAALSDNNQNRKKYAARALREIGPDASDAIPSLGALLGEENAHTREYAVEALDKMPEHVAQVIPILQKFTLDADKNIRQKAHKAIEKMKETPGKSAPGKNVKPWSSIQSPLSTHKQIYDSYTSDPSNKDASESSGSGKSILPTILLIILLVVLVLTFCCWKYFHEEYYYNIFNTNYFIYFGFLFIVWIITLFSNESSALAIIFMIVATVIILGIMYKINVERCSSKSAKSVLLVQALSTPLIIPLSIVLAIVFLCALFSFISGLGKKIEK